MSTLTKSLENYNSHSTRRMKALSTLRLTPLNKFARQLFVVILTLLMQTFTLTTFSLLILILFLITMPLSSKVSPAKFHSLLDTAPITDFSTALYPTSLSRSLLLRHLISGQIFVAMKPTQQQFKQCMNISANIHSQFVLNVLNVIHSILALIHLSLALTLIFVCVVWLMLRFLCPLTLSRELYSLILLSQTSSCLLDQFVILINSLAQSHQSSSSNNVYPPSTLTTTPPPILCCCTDTYWLFRLVDGVPTAQYVTDHSYEDAYSDPSIEAVKAI